ncbi:MAG: LptF/LptG family permease [Candidatus Gastranaerophilales bacterium]|nr:LptF/LptG family permease [Candidatus Gastranaerophilales bacterium]
MQNVISKIKNFKIPKVTLLDKFILSQVLGATLVCLVLFIIVWIAPETLFKIIKKILRDTYTPIYGLKVLILEIPKVLAKAIPVGILLGSIFTFDRLSKNSELAILRGIGLSFNRIMAPVILLGVVLSFFCYGVNDKLVPIASQKLGESKGGGSHFVYIVENPDKTPKQNIIVSNFTPKEIFDITVMNFSHEKYTDATLFKSIVFAPVAHKTANAWELKDALIYDIDDDGIYKKVTRQEVYPILTEGKQAQEVFDLMLNNTRKERVFTNHQISKYAKLLKRSNFSDEYRYFKAKLYQRYLHPLTCILFAIIGCMLGFAPPRSQRLVGFTIAVGMIFGYYITLPFFDLLAQKAVLPPFIAASFPIILFIISIHIIKKVKDL